MDGIVASNHGGRQLDGTVSPLRVMPEIVVAVGVMPVMMDSGVQRGSDVLKVLALGTQLVFVGRLFLYAAAIVSEIGVPHAINLLATKINCDMGCLASTRWPRCVRSCFSA